MDRTIKNTDSLPVRFRKTVEAKDFPTNPDYNEDFSRAYHEAGHLYFHLFFDIWFEYVTLIKDGNSEAAVHHQGFEYMEDSGWFLLNGEQQARTFKIMSLAGLIAEAKYSSEYKWRTANNDINEMYSLFQDGGGKAQEIWDHAVSEIETNWESIVDLATIINDNPIKITRNELLTYPEVQTIIKKGVREHPPIVKP